MSEAVRRRIEAVWRLERPRIIGGLVRLTRDLDSAEDLAQEALVRALETWPESGVPENPGAWLAATARNRGIDRLRRRQMIERKHREMSEGEPMTSSDPLDDAGDDVLRLILIACHPVLSAEARVALTLRLVAGLSTEEIARAFLIPATTLSQRIVRAKRALGEADVEFEMPRGADLEARLPSVLEVVYLVFNEGYSASRGSDWIRPELCGEALRLGRALAARVTDHPEVLGLAALMELQASRSRARSTASGEPILLFDQDRSRWDQLLIRRGLASLARAESLLDGPPGFYLLQAAIAACHARARTAAETDWPRIVALYDGLAALTGSPVVELNRAVAISMAGSPADALELVDAIAGEPAMQRYHLLHSVRADLLARLGRRDEAREALGQAIELAGNDRERALLEGRRAEL